MYQNVPTISLTPYILHHCAILVYA